MDCKTKFVYQNSNYIINDSPQYPVSVKMLQSDINSKFQDGYVTSRPRITPNFYTYILNFVAVSEEDKIIIQELEDLVGTTDIFEWHPSIPLQPIDIPNIKIRKVRLVEPINFELQYFKLYNFTMNLQLAIPGVENAILP